MSTERALPPAGTTEYGFTTPDRDRRHFPRAAWVDRKPWKPSNPGNPRYKYGFREEIVQAEIAHKVIGVNQETLDAVASTRD